MPRDDALPAMLDALAHRGPDDAGQRLFAAGDARAALGHRRLTILDAAGGAQPMALEAAGLSITFNGEIYGFPALRRRLQAAGHAFTTRSDTEAILHAYAEWGADCVRHLDGMFAFALWDAPRRRLLLARDRFGQKPLFLARRPSGLLFASEPGALLPLVGARPEPAAVDAFLAYRYVPGPATFFAGIEKLPPGCIATCEAGAVRISRYWSPPDADPPAPRDPESLLTLLDQAVQRHLLADVPCGAFLSGGLDSASITALMARHAGPVDSFAAGFDAPGFSELAEAAHVARHLGTRHHEVLVGPSDYPATMRAATVARGAPVSEPSDIALLALARLAAPHVKVVLSGEGADELLGGYPKHRAERWSAVYRGLVPAWARPSRLPRRLALAAEAMGLDAEDERFARWFGALTLEGRAALLASPPKALVAPEGSGTTPLRRLLHFDQTSWLPDNLLERGDRMTMAASVEARAPFLDETLVAAVSTWPDRLRLGKRPLRAAMAGLLPARTLTRRKVGFRAPMDAWFRGPLRPWLHDLLGPGARTRPLYRAAALDRILAEHAAGQDRHGKLLWALLALEVFCREHGLTP